MENPAFVDHFPNGNPWLSASFCPPRIQLTKLVVLSWALGIPADGIVIAAALSTQVGWEWLECVFFFSLVGEESLGTCSGLFFQYTVQ